MSLRDLLANPLLGLQRADAFCTRWEQAARKREVLPVLEAGGVHEWFLQRADARRDAPWYPPLTLLAALAMGESREPVIWIGRRCWPSLKLLHDLYGSLSDLRRLAVFVDPATDKERFWVMEEVLRCAGVHAMVADGSGMTATISRRLQLAAEAGSVKALLARPPWEAGAPSWAMTRWRVRPVVSRKMWPRWEIAAGKGARDAQWIVEYEVRNGKGSLHIPADVGCGIVSAEPKKRGASA